MELRFSARVIPWRGPYFYARLPADAAAEIGKVKKAASYGWGVVPVQATIGTVSFTTSLFPKDETYLLPLRLAVRRQLGVTADDEVEVVMRIAAGGVKPASHG